MLFPIQEALLKQLLRFFLCVGMVEVLHYGNSKTAFEKQIGPKIGETKTRAFCDIIIVFRPHFFYASSHSVVETTAGVLLSFVGAS